MQRPFPRSSPPVSSGDHAVPTAYAVHPAHCGSLPERPAARRNAACAGAGTARTAPMRPRTTLWGLGAPSQKLLGGNGLAPWGVGPEASLHMAEDTFLMTSPWVIAAMIRSVPLIGKTGQVPRSRANTRFSRQRPAPVARCRCCWPQALSPPGWRGVDVIAPAWPAVQRQTSPPYLTRWTRGSGTRAASFSNSSRR